MSRSTRRKKLGNSKTGELFATSNLGLLLADFASLFFSMLATPYILGRAKFAFVLEPQSARITSG
jgi:hypothetical protein